MFISISSFILNLHYNLHSKKKLFYLFERFKIFINIQYNQKGMKMPEFNSYFLMKIAYPCLMNRNNRSVVRIAGIIALVIIGFYVLSFFLSFIVSPILMLIGKLISFAFTYVLPVVVFAALIIFLYNWLRNKK